MTAAAPPERRVLTGSRFELHPLDPDRHADALFAAGHHGTGIEELWAYMSHGPFENSEAMHAWLQTCAASDMPLSFAVIERATGRAEGMCSFLNVDQPMQRLEIGSIWYTPRLQGSGINTDVALMLLTEAFERLGYRRVEWKCNALNERSRRAALALGFTFEGVFRQHMIVKGRNRDTAWFSLLDREWPAAKAVLQQRLS